ncbi:MAG: carboxypeptidase regulatory-like domain-containing protein [Phycisphaerae bacterium]|nr:carboxypeptidase regulatory-like domain-containing protein [Phycisphaerae bacterium]
MMPALPTPDDAIPIGRRGSESETTGVISVLIIRATWADTPTADPQSAASVMSMMASVDAFMQENSFGATSMVTTVTDLIVLPGTQAHYTAAGIESVLNDARMAAANANPNWNYINYDLEAVRYQGGPGNFSGAAYVGARGCWLKSSSPGVAAHEFGHNFGLWHANYWTPTAAETIVGPGANQEYGDTYDTMGSATAGANHFNSYEKNRLGWLPSSNVTTVTSNGVYRIHAHDRGVLDANNSYAIRIQRDPDRDYWIEFRQHPGYASNSWLMNGVTVRWDPWASSNNGSHLLDTTPLTPDAKNDAGIALGRTWTDPVYGISITPVAKIPGTVPAMDVQIAFTRSPNAPTGSLSASSLNVGVGQPVNFTATGFDADGNPLHYYWDFGDRTFAGGSASAVKSWSSAGQYRVRLSISDGTGNVYSTSRLITVGTPPSNRYRVEGKILDRTGNPAPGILVHNGLASNHANYRFGYTDSDGTYTLTNVVSGTYTINAVLGGSIQTALFTNPLSVTAHRSDVDFSTRQQAFKITGKVLDVAGMPVPGALVSNGLITEPTDLNGNYTLPNTPLGAYPLTAVKPGYDLFRSPQLPAVVNFADATGVNINERGFQLMGQVIGTPPGQLLDVTTGSNTLQFLTGSQAVHFTLRVPAGLAYLRAVSPGATYTPTFSNPLNVGSNLTGLNLTYGPLSTFSISGRVTDLGNGVGGATVTLAPGSQTIQTDSRGYYYFDGLSPGNYTLSVAKDGLSFVNNARPVTISGSSLTSENFTSTTINSPPTIATPAFANPNPTNRFTVAIGALGADDQGEPTLRYDWSVVTTPPGGSATFELDNFNSARNTFVTFNGVPGSYRLRVTVIDLYGASTASEVVVNIDTTPPTLLGPPLFTFESGQGVMVTFSENVGGSLLPSNFIVQNLTAGQPVDPSMLSLTYDPATNSALLGVVGNALPDGNYRVTLNPAGITDLAGNPLAGGAQLDFFVLAGDANRDRSVNLADFSVLSAHFNTAGTFSQGDFDYTGLVDLADFAILATRFNQSLPPAFGGRPAMQGVGRSVFASRPLEEGRDQDRMGEPTVLTELA